MGMGIGKGMGTRLHIAYMTHTLDFQVCGEHDGVVLTIPDDCSIP